ncbi:MAG: STAS domain-containing protein [Bacteroidetes bacterium]|nr:STAS domain-containing protein [Bacteroidota bacterium]HET6244251.1 STAS domain-containing protein [Bacteroidia bacterium]
MSFVYDKNEKFTLIKSTAERLDSSISPILKSELVVINSNGEKNIILDLSDTRYCDSSGLSAILVGNRLCKNANGTFIVTGLQSSVKKLIAISQLDTILKITPTLNEAMDLLFMEEIERDLE